MTAWVIPATSSRLGIASAVTVLSTQTTCTKQTARNPQLGRITISSNDF